MNWSVCISVYIVGFLVFPFFCSFTDGWPFAPPRMYGEDTFVSFILCALWPLVTLIWLTCVWWCGVSWLGVSARKLCGRFMKTLGHTLEHYKKEAK